MRLKKDTGHPNLTFKAVLKEGASELTLVKPELPKGLDEDDFIGALVRLDFTSLPSGIKVPQNYVVGIVEFALSRTVLNETSNEEEELVLFAVPRTFSEKFSPEFSDLIRYNSATGELLLNETTNEEESDDGSSIPN